MSTQAQLLANIIQKFFDNDGNELVEGKLYSYMAGTSTPLATYTDATAATPNSNPVILDATGSANIWITNQGYKFVLNDRFDNLIKTVDNVYNVIPGSIITNLLADGAVTTPKIADAAVTTAKIVDAAVTSAKIQPNAIIPGLIPAGSITPSILDQNSDFTGMTRMIEIGVQNEIDGAIKIRPQYPWTNPVLLANPATLPAGSGQAAAWSPNGEFLAVAHSVSPFVTIYQNFNGTFYKLPNPATLPTGQGNGVAWSPDGQFLAVGHVTSPFVTIYQKFGFSFTKLANPATLPAGNGFEIGFSKGGEWLSVSSATNFQNYQFGGTIGTPTFTAAALPGTLPGTATEGGVWSPDGQFVAYGSPSSPFIFVYRFSWVGSALFTKISDPGTLPAGTVVSAAWSPDGTMLALGLGVSPFLALYTFSGGLLAKIADPATMPTNAVDGLSWTQNSQYLACASISSPFLVVYSRSGAFGTTFTALPSPVGIPAGAATGAFFSPNGEFLAVTLGVSPFIQIYQTASLNFPSDALTWIRRLASPNV